MVKQAATSIKVRRGTELLSNHKSQLLQAASHIHVQEEELLQMSVEMDKANTDIDQNTDDNASVQRDRTDTGDDTAPKDIYDERLE